MPLIIAAIFTIESEHIGKLTSLNSLRIKINRIMLSLETPKNKKLIFKPLCTASQFKRYSSDLVFDLSEND